MSKRNTKRQRREPIPTSRLTVPPQRHDPAAPVPPAFDGSSTVGSLLRGPVEALPSYAVLTAIHIEMGGKAVNACLPVRYQIVGALRQFGFKAEMMAVYVEAPGTTGTTAASA